MIVYQPVETTVNVNGRPERVLDTQRVDSQMSLLVSSTNGIDRAVGIINDIQTAMIKDQADLLAFMEFYFSMHPGLERAFNDWKIAQKTKERILDGHSND